MADRLGQQCGNYRLVSLLGQGGYAEVYLGQHVRFKQQAAIKVLHAHLSDAGGGTLPAGSRDHRHTRSSLDHTCARF